jgi:hypothetical protein
VSNEFFLAEIFEIKDFLVLERESSRFKLTLPNDFAINLLKVADPVKRCAPFALPHPCNIVHAYD